MLNSFRKLKLEHQDKPTVYLPRMVESNLNIAYVQPVDVDAYLTTF